jgi:hypothetical protein
MRITRVFKLFRTPVSVVTKRLIYSLLEFITEAFKLKCKKTHNTMHCHSLTLLAFSDSETL